MNAILLLDAAEEAARIRKGCGELALHYAAHPHDPVPAHAFSVLASEVAILADLIERVTLAVATP